MKAKKIKRRRNSSKYCQHMQNKSKYNQKIMKIDVLRGIHRGAAAEGRRLCVGRLDAALLLKASIFVFSVDCTLTYFADVDNVLIMLIIYLISFASLLFFTGSDFRSNFVWLFSHYLLVCLAGSDFQSNIFE